MAVRRRIAQYDQKGNLLGVYDSIREAEQLYSCTHISSVCRGERSQEKGYVWRYVPEERNEEGETQDVNAAGETRERNTTEKTQEMNAAGETREQKES